MKIFLAADHTGFSVKEKMKNFLTEKGFDVTDCGATTLDPQDDYPAIMHKAAQAVAADPENNRGIIMGGSGQGEAIVANKVAGIRCSLFYTPALPKQAINIEGTQAADPFVMLGLTREHNGSNMLSLGVRFLSEEEMFQAVTVWLAAPGPTNDRHLRRIEQIKELEKHV